MSEWDQLALKRLRAKLGDSAIFFGLLSGEWRTDPTPLLELGLAIMMEKPLYFVAPEGMQIPPALERVADAIERYRGPEDYEMCVTRLLERARAAGHVR